MKKQILGIGLLTVVALGACSKEATYLPGPGKRLAEHVVVISIDGCRPDAMLRANTPTLRGLMARGSFTMWAETTKVAITLPSHTSMLTGVTPDRHGITWNKDIPRHEIRKPLFPTLFQAAKAQGLSTAMVTGKSKLIALEVAGGIDHVLTPPAKLGYDDVTVGKNAAALLIEKKPAVTFVHLGDVDGAGHKDGWGTQSHVSAIEQADAAVGEIVAALESTGMMEKTLIIISADHGGSGITHGAQLKAGVTDMRSRHIPWICVGPGVLQDFDLTRHRDLVIRTEDTFATACYFLNVPVNETIDGRPVMAALTVFAERELMQSK